MNNVIDKTVRKIAISDETQRQMLTILSQHCPKMVLAKNASDLFEKVIEKAVWYYYTNKFLPDLQNNTIESWESNLQETMDK